MDHGTPAAAPHHSKQFADPHWERSELPRGTRNRAARSNVRPQRVRADLASRSSSAQTYIDRASHAAHRTESSGNDEYSVYEIQIHEEGPQRNQQESPNDGAVGSGLRGPRFQHP